MSCCTTLLAGWTKFGKIYISRSAEYRALNWEDRQSTMYFKWYAIWVKIECLPCVLLYEIRLSRDETQKKTLGMLFGLNSKSSLIFGDLQWDGTCIPGYVTNGQRLLE